MGMKKMSTNATKYFDDPDISRILTRILEDQGGFCTIENRTGAGQEPGIATTTDPVKLYMREMGSIFLLTQAEEVAIAKRIEITDLPQLGAAFHSLVIRNISH